MKSYTDNQSEKKHLRANVRRKIIVTIVLAVLLIILLIPLWWAVVLSFDRTATTSLPPFSWLPHELSLFNYIAARGLKLWQYYRNTIILTLINTFISITFAMMCGFAFAKGNFFGKKVLYVFMLAVMVSPFESRLVPLYLLYKSWGLLNSWWPLILGNFGYVYGIFFARQNIASIPDSLLESMRLDGAGEWKIFARLIVPLSKPVISTLAILQVIGQWNSYLWPLVVVRDQSKQVISVGVSMFNASQNSIYYGPRMAVAVISALPLLVMFLLLQKYIVESVAMSGIKQ